MEYLIGLLLASAVAGMAAIVGLDRDRAFYPTAERNRLILRAVCCNGSFSEDTHN